MKKKNNRRRAQQKMSRNKKRRKDALKRKKMDADRRRIWKLQSPHDQLQEMSGVDIDFIPLLRKMT